MTISLYAASFDDLDLSAGPAYGGPYFVGCVKNVPKYADVFLQNPGPNKILIIKLLRSYHLDSEYNLSNFYYSDRNWYNKSLTLKEAKDIVDKPLSVIYEDVYMVDAYKIKEVFEKLGAKIEIVVTSWDQGE